MQEGLPAELSAKGDAVTILPSMIKSKISGIDVMEKILAKAVNGDSVTITLEDQVDVSRGNLIVKENELPESGQDITLMTCWFNESAAQNREQIPCKELQQ